MTSPSPPARSSIPFSTTRKNSAAKGNCSVRTSPPPCLQGPTKSEISNWKNGRSRPAHWVRFMTKSCCRRYATRTAWASCGPPGSNASSRRARSASSGPPHPRKPAASAWSRISARPSMNDFSPIPCRNCNGRWNWTCSAAAMRATPPCGCSGTWKSTSTTSPPANGARSSRALLRPKATAPTPPDGEDPPPGT